MNKKHLIASLPILIMVIGIIILKNAWAAIIGYHAIILLTIIIASERNFQILFKGFNLTYLLIFSVAGLTSGISIYILWPIVSNSVSMLSTLETLGLNGFSFYIFSIYYTLTTPFLEEYFWRDILFLNSTKPVLTDFLFAAYHTIVLYQFIKIEWILFSFLILSLTAWMWRLCRMKFNGLIIPIFSHLIADLSIIIATLFLLEL